MKNLIKTANKLEVKHGKNMSNWVIYHRNGEISFKTASTDGWPTSSGERGRFTYDIVDGHIDLQIRVTYGWSYTQDEIIDIIDKIKESLKVSTDLLPGRRPGRSKIKESK